MAWKGVHITRPARLSIRQSQLCVEQDETTTVPLEDVAWIILDSHQATVTVSLLASCAEQGIALITSDRRHMPSALTLPFHTHHRTAAIARLQLDAPSPFKKRLWQTIIRAKINNQAKVLRQVGRLRSEPLDKMAKRVRSGDPENVEAQAARAYWRALFDDFTRANETDLRNKMLNYAYAVLRGCVARALVACGFLPAIGIHHESVTNPFNLVDDVMEPLRPLADLAVLECFHGRETQDGFTREDRQVLSGLPLREALVGSEVQALLHASEAMAQSLGRAFEQRDVALFFAPSLPDEQSHFLGLPP